MQRQEKQRNKASCHWTGSRLSTPAINVIDLMEMVLFWHSEWYVLIANSSSAGIGNKEAIETLQKQGIKKGHCIKIQDREWQIRLRENDPE